MATNTGKKARRTARETNSWPVNIQPVHPLNYAQEAYMDAIKRSDITFGIGSAGTGKTFMAADYAARELYAGRIKKIYLTRPVVEMGKSMGYLPGELDEKYKPYLEPFEDYLRKTLSDGYFEYCLKEKTIEPKPLSYLRGKNFSDCIVLADEVQNMNLKEFYGLLTRVGKNCKYILSGDPNPNQIDIKDSGLGQVTRILNSVEGVEVVNFMESDIVRSKLCKAIVKAFNSR